MKSVSDMKNAASDSPEVGKKFVAFYSDGGGASLFKRVGTKLFIGADGEKYTDENMDVYFYWQYLPDNFEFWYEAKDIN